MINYKQPKLITEIPGIGNIQGITPDIQTVRGIQHSASLVERRDAYNYAKRNTHAKNFLANYNDPEELNSYLDALVNRKAVSKEFGEAWGTISTISGTVAVVSFIAAAALAAAAFFTSGATAPAAGAAAKGGATAAGAATGVSAKAAATAAALKAAAATATKVGAIAATPAIPAATKVT